MRYKLKLFHNLKIALVGLSEEDKTQMEDLVQKNGGTITQIEDSSTTHVVSYSFITFSLLIPLDLSVNIIGSFFTEQSETSKIFDLPITNH